mmetsp:Transcript_43225/g.113738  ORF Transcript_43225/g.113738 Transcript_43225/m.113738 type:complete len:248 (+) Transcript_43225:734-1477(+)
MSSSTSGALAAPPETSSNATVLDNSTSTEAGNRNLDDFSDGPASTALPTAPSVRPSSNTLRSSASGCTSNSSSPSSSSPISESPVSSIAAPSSPRASTTPACAPTCFDFLETHPNLTTMAVLSSRQPLSSDFLTKAAAAVSSVAPPLRKCWTKRTASLSDTASQIPSLAKMTNSSPSQSKSCTTRSGSALTISGFLKSLSPRPRETARPVTGVLRFFGGIHLHTPPILATAPPSASMRFFSKGKLGL